MCTASRRRMTAGLEWSTEQREWHLWLATVVFLSSVVEMCLFIKYNRIILQLAVPLGKGDQRVKSLGNTDHIQRSGILPRPGKDQRRECSYPEWPQRKPVAWSWNSSSFHWLLCIQCQHQSLLCYKVLDLNQDHIWCIFCICMSKIIHLVC